LVWGERERPIAKQWEHEVGASTARSLTLSPIMTHFFLASPPATRAERNMSFELAGPAKYKKTKLV